MSPLSFYLMIAAVIAAAGFTILALTGIFGFPALPILALLAALASLILGRSKR